MFYCSSRFEVLKFQFYNFDSLFLTDKINSVIILLNYSNKSLITSLIDKSNELVNKPIIILETPHVLVGNDCGILKGKEAVLTSSSQTQGYIL